MPLRIPIQWIPAGQSILVSGFTIPGGLIWVGTPGPEQNYQRSYAHLIDPNLPIQASHADVGGSTMSYWPHYSDLTPSARLANLQWHATGRRDARYGIGYIFLFFYGLEQRLFVDKSRADHDAIVREVSELMDVYGDNQSFRNYATTFLKAALLEAGHLPPLPTLSALQVSYGLPTDFRVALAQRLNEGPLSAEWLLAWYLAHPEKSLRTPATRCFAEFKALFVARFNAEYPKGLNVRKSSRKLSVEYRSASGAFTTNLSDRFPGLTDPDAIAAPLKIAADLAGSCAEALDAYSRQIGRNPNSAGSLAAQILLPVELRTSMATNPDFQALKATFATLLERSIAQVPLSKLLSLTAISSNSDARISSATASRLAEALALLDIGMEPDNRYGGKLPVTSGLVTIFKSPNGAAIEAVRPEYTAARVLVEVAVLAAGIEGNDVRAGLRAILDEVDRLPSISSVERLRLSAYVLHLNWVRTDKMSGWQRLASLPIAERERIAHVALCALTADGRIEGPEIKFAERLYGALGIPLQRLYNDIHRQTGDEPQTVRPAETHTGGTPIPTRPQKKPDIVLQPSPPPPPSDVSTTVGEILGSPKKVGPKAPAKVTNGASTPPLIVNSEVLKRTRQDTADVRIILDGVYRADDLNDDTTPGVPAAPSSMPQRYPGLDRGHEALLDLMLNQQGTMQRAAFDVEVKKLKLFTDGALDKINDWSFDHFGDSLIEDGDPLTIPPHLLVRLKEMAVPT
ncbi:MAG: TerB N-terminal domain-containing protein [Hyphomicrobium sp.]